MKRYLLAITALCLLAAALAFSPTVRAKIADKFTTTASFKTGDWTTVNGAIDIIKQIIETDSPDKLAEDLYAYVTDDVKDFFDLEDFKKGIFDAKLEVLSTEILNQNDEWAKVKMRLKSNGSEQDFMVILKKEDGAWKLFATEAI